MNNLKNTTVRIEDLNTARTLLLPEAWAQKLLIVSGATDFIEQQRLAENLPAWLPETMDPRFISVAAFTVQRSEHVVSPDEDVYVTEFFDIGDMIPMHGLASVVGQRVDGSPSWFVPSSDTPHDLAWIANSVAIPRVNITGEPN